MIKIQTPLTFDKIKNLKVGDLVYLSGIIFTARDAAHEKIVNLIQNNQEPPFSLKNQVIYYTGPTPTKKGKVIGSVGPTTAYRMDSYTNILLENGLRATIGKGNRANYVKDKMKEYKAIYFAAIGGTAALMAKSVVSNKIIAYPELQSEAIRKLEVINMPLIVANDINGDDLFDNYKNYGEK